MVKILNADGSPMRAAASQPTPYHAADPMRQEMEGWNVGITAPDADVLLGRDTSVARARDLVRNNGYAAGAATSEVDTVIGAQFRLSYKPDWKALGLDAEWAAGFARAVEAQWRLYAFDIGRYCDAARHLTVPGLFGQAYRHYLVDGEALAVLLWRPGRGGDWATALQIVHPDRLSNPNLGPDLDTLRGGIELGEDGQAVAYHIRRRHPGDVWGWGGADAYVWERVERETAWGRPIVIHYYDKLAAEQHRGVSRFAAILEKFKMGDHYGRVELQAAVLNAILGAFIESPFDHDLLSDALSDGRLSDYQRQRKEFHDRRQLSLGGVRLPTLYPGERITALNAARPATQFAEFEAAALRNIAAGLGTTYEQLSRDWSRVNYSSARAALLEIWRSLGSRRQQFADGFATPVFAAWLEETIDSGRVELPPGAPDFWSARAAYTRCRWIGPGRGWIDPLKERQAAVLGIASGFDTLESVCAEQGQDYEEVLDQLAREIAQMPPGVMHPAQADFAKYLGAMGMQPRPDQQE